jgi:hypothetical protein
MPAPIAEQILSVLKEGLGLWKTFIATRQEAYNRQQDKKQVAAIEMAEKHIFNADELVAKLKIKYPDIMKDKMFSKPIDKMAYYRRKFFKFH